MTQEPYQQIPPSTPNSNLATISVIAGILGWTIAPFLGSLAAIITGHMAKREIRESMGQLAGDGMATAGLIMGYLHLILSTLCICIVLIIIAMGVSIPLLDSIPYIS